MAKGLKAVAKGMYKGTMQTVMSIPVIEQRVRGRKGCA